jgi:hypothetical protein
MKLLGVKFIDQRSAYCNLDLFAQMQGQGRDVDIRNPYLDAHMCAEMVSEAAQYLRANYTHGGYGEDRRVLWRGSYLEEGAKFIHLGHDTNVQAGTPLHMPFSGVVLAAGDDTEAFGPHGWGRWCIVQPNEDVGLVKGKNVFVVFAHLGDVPSEGTEYSKGEQFATVGTPETNGGWYPHVHTQVVDAVQHPFFDVTNLHRNDWQRFMTELDGYASVEDFRRDAGRVYHDPLNWIW